MRKLDCRGCYLSLICLAQPYVNPVRFVCSLCHEVFFTLFLDNEKRPIPEGAACTDPHATLHTRLCPACLTLVLKKRSSR